MNLGSQMAKSGQKKIMILAQNARKMPLESVEKSGFFMFQPGPNDALSQNFMKLGLLVAEKNVDRQTDTHTHTRFMFYKYRCTCRYTILTICKHVHVDTQF